MTRKVLGTSVYFLGVLGGGAAGLIGGLVGCAAPATRHDADASPARSVVPQSTSSMTRTFGDASMKLGNFSVSLAVKDIAASRSFYEKLGFKQVGGDQSKNWIVLKNEETKIGLFQGMFPKNMLTFNPGWDSSAGTLADFVDVRDIQKALKARGLALEAAADEATTGPAYITLTDPDGNPILIDQHVPSPKK